MFINYFKIARRNLWKHKAFSFINIIGLTAGLTSFILISLYIFDEFNYDRFHVNVSKIYRVVDSKVTTEGKSEKKASTGYQVSASAVNVFPEIENVARLSPFVSDQVISGDDRNVVFEETFLSANQGMLDVFSFPLLYGEVKSALTNPHSVVLTERAARKYFRKTDAVGKSLIIWGTPFQVTGILKELPNNSSISFQMLVSESSFLNNKEGSNFTSHDWSSGSFTTYLQVRKNANVLRLAHKLDSLRAANSNIDSTAVGYLQLQALADVHFYSDDIEGDSGRKGNLTYSFIFLVVAAFIILLACINYMNLSTAQFTSRGKEIAVRKVAGASRTSLVKQFLTEALLVSFLSTLLAVVIVIILLPAFNQFTEKQLTLYGDRSYIVWLGILSVVLIVGLLAGLYPAMVQSGFRPLVLLKGKIGLGSGNMSLRRALVVFQFMISIVFIAATIIIYKQMVFVNQREMGFDKENIVIVNILSSKVRSSAETVMAEFAKLPEVKGVTVSSAVPGELKTIPTVSIFAGQTSQQKKEMYFFGVDHQFLSSYDIKLMDGRNFFPSRHDSSSVLINETAAHQLGIAKAEGQTITIPSARFGSDNRSELNGTFTATLVGIVKDFNYQSLHEPLAPMVLGYRNNPVHSIGYFSVKLGAANIEESLVDLNKALQSVDPAHVFQYRFLDQQWDMLYREDNKRQVIFLGVSMLAISIAALGLLGLSVYAAGQRLKEIGVRKVLGASVGGIAVMLSKDFLRLVLTGALIAVPISWYFMNRWLEDFAFRISINGWDFVLSALIGIVIAIGTIAVQVIRAARANPVKVLKME